MRISDWSSDVCSSDLALALARKTAEDDAATAREQAERAAGELKLTAEERDRLMAELSTTRDRTKTLETRLSTAEERTTLAQREIEQRDIRIEELVASLGTTESRSEEHTSELQSLMRISYAVFC